MFLSTEIDVDCRRRVYGYTALHEACGWKAAKTVATLLAHDASALAKDRNGRTPKQHAIEENANDDVIGQLETA